MSAFPRAARGVQHLERRPESHREVKLARRLAEVPQRLRELLESRGDVLAVRLVERHELRVARLKRVALVSRGRVVQTGCQDLRYVHVAVPRLERLSLRRVFEIHHHGEDAGGPRA